MLLNFACFTEFRTMLCCSAYCLYALRDTKSSIQGKEDRKSYWQKFRERNQVRAKPKGKSNGETDDILRVRPDPPDTAIPTAFVNPERMALINSATSLDRSAGMSNDRNKRHGSVASTDAPSAPNGKARRQARAKQKKAGAQGGMRRDEPNYTLGSRVD